MIRPLPAPCGQNVRAPERKALKQNCLRAFVDLAAIAHPLPQVVLTHGCGVGEGCG